MLSKYKTKTFFYAQNYYHWDTDTNDDDAAAAAVAAGNNDNGDTPTCYFSCFVITGKCQQ